MSAASERVKAWRRRHPARARAVAFRRNNRVDLLELPPYPANGKCELCGYLPTGKRLHWDHDHSLEDFGYPLQACHRGWLCYRCNTMFGHIEAVGVTKTFDYLTCDRIGGQTDNLTETDTKEVEEEGEPQEG